MAATADNKHEEVFANDSVSPEGTVATEPAVYEKDEVAKQNQADAAAATTTTAGASKEEKVTENETKVTAQPVTSGVLGYKAPGLMSHLRFSKRFFYLSDDSVDVKDLSTYLHGEKADVAHPNVAYASQTGKGLLFVVKREEDKKTPSSILNLADATDVAKVGATEFSFKIHGQKHDFQAPTTELRNGWLVAIEAAAEKGKAAREEILGSDGYKESLASLKPVHQAAPVAAAGAATATGAAATAAVVASEEKKDETAEKPEEKKDDKLAKPQPKSRSVSRNNTKRSSIFGGLLGKKDEDKKDAKVEEPAKVETPADVQPVKEEEAEDKVEDKPEHKEGEEVAAAGAVAAGAATTGAVVEHEKADEPKTETETGDKSGSQKSAPKDKKRTSIFGSLFGGAKSPSPSREKKEEELIPAIKEDSPVVTADAPAKEVAKAAEVLPAPAAATDPSKAESGDVTAVTADAKDADVEKADEVLPAPAAATDASKAEKADKRRSMFGLGAKSGEKKEEKSGSGKFTEMFRRPSKAAKAAKDKAAAAVQPETVPEKTEEKTEETAADKAAEPTSAGAEASAAPVAAEKTDEPVIGDVVPEAVSVGSINKEVQATA